MNSYKGQNKECKEILRLWLALITGFISLILLLSSVYIIKSNLLFFISYFIFLIPVYVIIYIFLVSKTNNFNKITCWVLGLFAFMQFPFIIYMVSSMVNKIIKVKQNFFLLVPAMLILVLWVFIHSIYLWVFYLCVCKKILTEINQGVFLFFVKVIWSIITSVLVFCSGTIFIMLFKKGDSDFSIIYQALNIFINIINPFIEMYTYVREKLDEFHKQGKQKQEKEKREELEKESTSIIFININK